MKIELSSNVIGKPRVPIDLVNPPDNLEEIVQDYFADYTSGTNPDYMDDDKLAYIDLLRKKIHPEKKDSYEAVKKKLTDWFEYELDEGDRVPDISDCWSMEFFESCYEDGDMKLYDTQYGWKEMNHHEYDRIHHTLVRIISAIINYEVTDEMC